MLPKAPNGQTYMPMTINSGTWNGGETTIQMTGYVDDVMYMKVYDYEIRIERKKYDLREEKPYIVWTDYKAFMEDEETPTVTGHESHSGDGCYAFQTELGESGIVRDNPDIHLAIAQVFCNII